MNFVLMQFIKIYFKSFRTISLKKGQRWYKYLFKQAVEMKGMFYNIFVSTLFKKIFFQQ